jgi:2-amino-4-hydroxy-6-hydroxymethyldihydropteridine diphosphokinase
MNKAYLLTGGNMGHRESNLALAVELIQKDGGKIIAHSALYETAAWGNSDQPGFLNQALLLETRLDAAPLLHLLLAIEKQIGRVRLEKYGPRVIDIDILLFNQEIHHEPALKIPHPELANRRFALTPLAEIAADYVHPVLKKTIAKLLEECPDKLAVNKL